MTRCQTWRAYRAQSHIDQKLTLRPAEAGASSGPPMDVLLTSKCVKFIGSEAEWVIRAFVEQRENVAANAAIRKRLAEIDKAAFRQKFATAGHRRQYPRRVRSPEKKCDGRRPPLQQNGGTWFVRSHYLWDDTNLRHPPSLKLRRDKRLRLGKQRSSLPDRKAKSPLL